MILDRINRIYRMKEEELTGKIIGCAMKVHRALGNGFLESVYQNALAFELQRAGLRAECEVPIKVFYDGIDVGAFYADILVEKQVIVENKAVEQLCSAHEVQLVNYLTATDHNVGLLFNFGSSSLQYKKKFRVYRKPDSNPVNPG
jgi:GxxExxY protein